MVSWNRKFTGPGQQSLGGIDLLDFEPVLKARDKDAKAAMYPFSFFNNDTSRIEICQANMTATNSVQAATGTSTTHIARACYIDT